MTYATVDEALAALRATPAANQTVTFLREIASEVSVFAEGKITVIFG